MDSSDNEDAELKQAQQRLGEVLDGRYRLESVQGIGGFGVVFRALDCESGDLVAVKTLRPSLAQVPSVVARFVREARISLRLSHPAIPRGIAVGMDPRRRPYLAMEFVLGTSLEDLVEARGPFPAPAALAVGARVAEALAVAHREGVIHRDIKPANLMLMKGASIPEGICVLDFGIALCVDEPRFTRANMFVGSPAYMPPEQARGELVTASGDLYALGCTLVHLLSGRPLYGGTSEYQIVCHGTAALPDLRARVPELSLEAERLLRWMLQKDPSQRPGVAAEVATQLWRLSGVRGTPATPSTESLPPGEPLASTEELMEQLRKETLRLHAHMRNAADAQNRLLRRLIDFAAQRIDAERRLLPPSDLPASMDARDAQTTQAAQPVSPASQLAQAREGALEKAIEELQRRARADQDEILARIRGLQQQLQAQGASPEDL